MGLRNWWDERQKRSASVSKSLQLNRDQTLVANQVPELAGMGEVEAMAYTFEQIEQWNAVCTKAQATELALRLVGSNASFETEGLTMPFWANLWVLRTYQAELGMDAPNVAPQIRNSN